MSKVGLLIFPFCTPHFVVWTPHFGWTLRLYYTVHTILCHSTASINYRLWWLPLL